MERTFPATLSQLRKDRNLSQRQAAAELNISQALLSHYENGAREPGLAFICRACDYYGVSADYMLCRTDDPNGTKHVAESAKNFLKQIKTMADRAEMVLDEIGESND